MRTSVKIIGSGSAAAKKYFNTSFLITSDICHYKLLLDCGGNVPQALFEREISVRDINGIFISHLHGDHTYGLEEIGFLCKFLYNKKMDLFVPVELIKPLWENVLKGSMEHIDDTDELQTLNDYFNVFPICENGKHHISEGICIEIVRTNHVRNKPSFGVYLNDKFFFTMDTKFNQTLIDTAMEREVNIIFHDCQLGFTGGIHASLDEILTFPEEVRSKIVLTHYSDSMQLYEDKILNMQFAIQGKSYVIPGYEVIDNGN